MMIFIILPLFTLLAVWILSILFKNYRFQIRYYKTENDLLITQKERLENEIVKMQFNEKWRLDES